MASEARRVRGEAQKNIVKAFESLCGRHSRWNVWADWITMSAIAISNRVDLVHREEREKTYRKIQEKYTAPEMQTMAEMLGQVVMALDENQDQDLLGELYMTLELGNDHAGQFFTPYDVCRFMAELNSQNIKLLVQEKGWIGAADPACGAGATLVAFVNECRRQGINYQTDTFIVGQDIDFTVAMMCYIQLSLLGCAGYIVIGDTLAHPATSIDSRGLIPRDDGNVWYMPMYFRDIWNWRRAFAQVDMMCRSNKPKEDKAEPQPALQEPQKPAQKAGKTKAKKRDAQEAETAMQRPEIAENEYGQLSLF